MEAIDAGNIETLNEDRWNLPKNHKFYLCFNIGLPKIAKKERKMWNAETRQPESSAL